MKRVNAACLCQTLHFELKDGVAKSIAAHAVRDEVAAYKSQLQRSGSKFQIVSEEQLSDGSFTLKVKKQVNSHPTGEYMD